MITVPEERKKQRAANHAANTVEPTICRNNEAAIEERIHAYGREIFARIDRHGPLPFTPSWFDDRLMNLTMREEALKVQLFRFIDTLPLLRDPNAVADHLREYLEAAGAG